MPPSSSCPRCGAPMENRPGVTVSCPACYGVFVAREDVASVVQSLEAGSVAVELGNAYRAAPVLDSARAADTEVRYLRCPICAKPMNRKRLIKRLDLTADICAAHGMWFDGGELHRIARHRERAKGDDDPSSGIDLGFMAHAAGVPSKEDPN